uniref:Uncharacterized protein n=1 Tax=viral metagenome TaxID=1070528 RepID=A0A6C0JDH1_9ZZZZ
MNDYITNYNPITSCKAICKSNGKQCSKASKQEGFCNMHYKMYLKGSVKVVDDVDYITNQNTPKKVLKKPISIKRRTFIQLEKYFLDIDKICIIQKMVRGFLIRSTIQRRGISCYLRHLVNNEHDFLTFENINDIPNKNYFSYKDSNDFTWGFDIITFKELLKNNQGNPYNTQEIDLETKARFLKLLYLIQNTRKVEMEKAVITDPFQLMQQKCIKVFQKMDDLEQYTQCEWFTELNLPELKELYKQILDIWDYRVQLSESDKLKYVTNGKLFTEGVSMINKYTDKNKLANLLLDNFDRLVSEGKTKQDKTTGALWILSSLTLVSLPARDALPWLFQSANVY